MSKVFISGWINIYSQTIPNNVELTYFDELGFYKGYLTT